MQSGEHPGEFNLADRKRERERERVREGIFRYTWHIKDNNKMIKKG